MSIKIKVGSLVLIQARDVDLPQEFAAWHQTVRVEPGSYDVFAYLDWEGSGYRIRSLSARCEGVTISSNFRSHMLGTWGKSDNNCNGKPAVAHVHLPTYGTGGDLSPILEQTVLCDAIVRTEWDPRDHDPRSAAGTMWRFTWNSAKKPIIIERSRHSGGMCLATFEDHRNFLVDGVEMSPADLSKIDVSFQGFLRSADQLTVGETVIGWSWRDKQSRQVTRVA